MSTYICEKCGYIENTACGGNYWSVKAKLNSFKDEYSNSHLLCHLCTSKEYKDGSTRKDSGIHIDRIHWTELGKEYILKAAEASCGNYVNAKEYFENLDKEENKNDICNNL